MCVNTLETWTDRSLKVERRIQSIAPGTEIPHATGRTGGHLARKLCWKRSSCSNKWNVSHQLILAGRKANSALFSLEKGKGRSDCCFQLPKRKVWRRQNQTLLASAQWKDKRQHMQVAKRETTIKYIKKLHKFPREVKASPSLERFKTQDPSNLLHVGPALTRGLDQMISKGPFQIKWLW